MLHVRDRSRLPQSPDLTYRITPVVLFAQAVIADTDVAAALRSVRGGGATAADEGADATTRAPAPTATTAHRNLGYDITLRG